MNHLLAFRQSLAIAENRCTFQSYGPESSDSAIEQLRSDEW